MTLLFGDNTLILAICVNRNLLICTDFLLSASQSSFSETQYYTFLGRALQNEFPKYFYLLCFTWSKKTEEVAVILRRMSLLLRSAYKCFWLSFYPQNYLLCQPASLH